MQIALKIVNKVDSQQKAQNNQQIQQSSWI